MAEVSQGAPGGEPRSNAAEPARTSAARKSAATPRSRTSAAVRSAEASTGTRPPRKAVAGRAKAVAGAKAAAARPSGRDEVIDAIISATLELVVEGGPSRVSLRRVAERANVNYGLVHRHFGTRAAVLRAAMTKAHEVSYERVLPAADVDDAISRILLQGSGAQSKMLAWGILQGEADTVLPAESLTLRRLSELALRELPTASAEESLAARVRVGVAVGALLGCRLFEPYLTRGLGLDHLSRDDLYALILPIVCGVVDAGAAADAE